MFTARLLSSFFSCIYENENGIFFKTQMSVIIFFLLVSYLLSSDLKVPIRSVTLLENSAQARKNQQLRTFWPVLGVRLNSNLIPFIF